MLKDVRALMGAWIQGLRLGIQGCIKPSQHLGRLYPHSDVFFPTSLFLKMKKNEELETIEAMAPD